MKKTRFHFFRLEAHASGRSLLTLPGQRCGREDIPSGVLVLDGKGCTALSKARRSGLTGETFYTTSLRRCPHCYTAADAASLDRDRDLLRPLALEAYEKLYGKPYESCISKD